MMLETCFGTLAEIYEASVGCVFVLRHKKNKIKIKIKTKRGN